MSPAPADRGHDRRENDRRQGGRRRDDDEALLSPEPGLNRGHGSEDGALLRIHRTYAATRAAFGIVLVAVHGASNVVGARVPLAVMLICIAYAAQAITLWLLPRFRPRAAPLAPPRMQRRQWVATIGVDLLAFGLLHVVQVGAPFNAAALLVLPVLMAGVTTQRLFALGTAAVVALMLLLTAWRGSLDGGELPVSMLQAGLAGVGLFVIALLSGELAGRMLREEQTALGSLELARQQGQLNRLVIEEMADGVLVVDAALRVRAANPAARALLVHAGLSPQAPFGLQAQGAWQQLAQAVEEALEQSSWPDSGREVALDFGAGTTRLLRMRVRYVRGRALAHETDSGPLAVVLLEDVRTAQARLRQEKLAAMGRVSAGIAHEIRNPLAAITQANALLLEDALAAPQQRLARIVADNAMRLKRIVDDVMELSSGSAAAPRSIDASAEVAAAAAEWAGAAALPLGPASRLMLALPAAPLAVAFDAEHLRRVLVNLLDNAHRHAGQAPGAIELRLSARDDGTVQLAVGSDGAPIAADVERHLFEPFFSTRSRGTGLGLYICRELCERYGASIDYHALPPGERARNRFVVTMQRSSLAVPVLNAA